MEQILLENSKNLTSLIQLMKLHEENIKKLISLGNDTDVSMSYVTYAEGTYSSILAPQYKTCNLSREYFQPQDKVYIVRECGHIFKKTPFLEWISKNKVCPICKIKI